MPKRGDHQHVQVSSATLAGRILQQTKHQQPGVSLEALLMATVAQIVAATQGMPEPMRLRFAAQCGQSLREGVSKDVAGIPEAEVQP